MIKLHRMIKETAWIGENDDTSSDISERRAPGIKTKSVETNYSL